MGLLDELNVDKADFDKIKADDVPEGYTLPAGVYDAVVDKAYIRKTDSGAKMLEVAFIARVGDEDKNFNWSTATQSGDEKGNKSTWTVRADHSDRVKKQYGVGTEVPLPGITEMKHFLQAIGDTNPATVMGEVKHKDETIEALCLTTVQGKRVKLGLRQEESLYNGEVNVRNKVQYWMDSEGKNGEGKDILEKSVAWLAKNPIKKLKQAPTPTAADAAGQAGAENLANAGW